MQKKKYDNRYVKGKGDYCTLQDNYQTLSIISLLVAIQISIHTPILVPHSIYYYCL